MKRWITKIFSIALIIGVIPACNEPLGEEELTNEVSVKSATTSVSSISQIVEDRYIVVFKNHVVNPKAEAEGLARTFGLTTGHIYEHALKGFSAYIPANAIRGLQHNPNIELIEPDITMQIFKDSIPTGVSRIQAVNPDGMQTDVDVAVLDTGVDDDHEDLNVAGGVRFYTVNTGPPSGRGSNSDSNYDDDNGHGTHVAGTIAAKDNESGVVGVAPGARIWAVKILNAQGSGYLSDIIAGLDWVTERANTIEVVNMSIGGQGLSTSYHNAIKNCVNAGVVVVVAAGNESMDIYGTDGKFGTNDDIIPAAYPEAAAISALADTDGKPGGTGTSTNYGSDDSFASFSNFSHTVVADNPVNSPGKAIDLILPGVNILSTYLSGQYALMSGTSMASPHAAGLTALYIAKNGRATNAEEVYAIRQALIDGGVPQNSAYGLTTLNDPDPNEENLGWAGNTSGNLAPVARAGEDQTITVSDGEELASVTLDGTGSSDDSGIVSYTWTEGGNTIATGMQPAVDLAVGSHTITLTVTDSEGLTGQDDVLITVLSGSANQPPAIDNFTLTPTSNPAWKRVAVNWTVSDPDGDLREVKTTLYNPDNQPVATSTSAVSGDSASGTHELGQKGGSSGTYTVEITVTDAAGNPTTVSKPQVL
jgi:subtilisin family serine protease